MHHARRRINQSYRFSANEITNADRKAKSEKARCIIIEDCREFAGNDPRGEIFPEVTPKISASSAPAANARRIFEKRERNRRGKRYALARDVGLVREIY